VGFIIARPLPGERQTAVLILIADSYEIVLAGLRSLIEVHPGGSVVAIAADDQDAIEQAVKTKPDVAVLGYEPPLSDAIEVTRQIRAKQPKPKSSSSRREMMKTVFFIFYRRGALRTQIRRQPTIDRRDRSACSPQALLYHQALREVGPVLYEAAREREKW